MLKKDLSQVTAEFEEPSLELVKERLEAADKVARENLGKIYGFGVLCPDFQIKEEGADLKLKEEMARAIYSALGGSSTPENNELIKQYEMKIAMNYCSFERVERAYNKYMQNTRNMMNQRIAEAILHGEM